MIASILLRLCVIGLFCLTIALPFSQENLFSANILKDVLTDVGVSSEEQTAPLPKLDTNDSAEEKVNSIIYTIIEILLILSGVVAVVFIVMGGVEYTVSAGEEDRLNGGKAKITYALMGLLIVIFSYAMLTNAINFLEVGE